MPSDLSPLTVPTLDVDAESTQRALHAARAPAAAVAAPRPDVRQVLQAARLAARELGVAPHPDLLRHACLVRFAASAWPLQDFHRCVLTCVAGHWLGVGQPYGLLEEGPAVFQVVEARGACSGVRERETEGDFRTDIPALRPAFRPEALSLSCCLNHARASVGLVDVAALAAALPQGLLDVAMQERFSQALPAALALRGSSGAGADERCALLRQTPLGWLASIDLSCTRPARAGDAAALQVLREIEGLARGGATWLGLQPGEVLFLRNRQVLHAEHAGRGERRMLRGYWRQSLIALGNFAGSDTPGMFSVARALRTA